LGICFGAQLFFVAFCRKILNMEDANTTEINENTGFPVVDFLEGQKEQKGTGGTMKLGAHEVHIKKGTKLYAAYKKTVIHERFRHRFHIMEKFLKDNPKANNLVISAKDPTGQIVNAIEMKDKDHWMVGTQFHAEYKSRPYKPSPLYRAFIKATIKSKNRRL
jgi:CTP synthase